ncbi:MAG: hypothetical protein ACI4QS_05275 [Comamonas sp.]
MSLLDKNTWYILKHLHHTIATQAAARVDGGDTLSPLAYLVSPAPAQDGRAGMNVAEVSAEFIAQLLAQEDGDRLLAKYLADALIEGSIIQQQIAREHGIQATYTFSMQEAWLPCADAAQPRPALMVLLNGRSFTLPIFHQITVGADGQRQCQLRPFPEMEEIEAVQHMLQARMQHNSTVH